ncbi:hypothetical protein CRH09_01490 [Nocardia terpenica]|uniref:Uncharacterized protein n=1 Tax=Nocardia terpenica TaxID=455432 RepID=A0A291RC46_9NOCA|nr:hypothetical protein CRH09_01490 [Nocardia terpenica]
MTTTDCILMLGKASTMPPNHTIDRCGAVVHHVPAIGNLDRVGCAAASTISVGTAADTAKYPDLQTTFQPVDDRARGTVLKQIDRSAGDPGW